MSERTTLKITDSLAAAKEAVDELEDLLAAGDGTAVTATTGYLRVISFALIAIAEGMPQE